MAKGTACVTVASALFCLFVWSITAEANQNSIMQPGNITSLSALVAKLQRDLLHRPQFSPNSSFANANLTLRMKALREGKDYGGSSYGDSHGSSYGGGWGGSSYGGGGSSYGGGGYSGGGYGGWGGGEGWGGNDNGLLLALLLSKGRNHEIPPQPPVQNNQMALGAATLLGLALIANMPTQG